MNFHEVQCKDRPGVLSVDRIIIGEYLRHTNMTFVRYCLIAAVAQVSEGASSRDRRRFPMAGGLGGKVFGRRLRPATHVQLLIYVR